MPYLLENEGELPRLPQVPGAEGAPSLGEGLVPALTAKLQPAPSTTEARDPPVHLYELL